MRTSLPAALLCLLLPLRAEAQQGPALYPGQPHHGSIVSYDQPIWGRGGFKTFWVELDAGRSYRFSAESRYLDTHLTLARVVNGVTEVVAEADAGGNGTDASLAWTAPATGRYLVIAQATRPGSTGNFTLWFDEARRPPSPPPPPPLGLRIGQEARGELTGSDPVLSADGSRYDAYGFHARRGQRLLIELRSSAFDAYLHLGRLSSGRWESLGTDDDGLGRGTDSRLRFLVPADGNYVVYANSERAGATGGYTLLVREAPVPARPTPQPFARGSSVSGTLADDDAVIDGTWEHYDLYVFDGSVGQQVQLEAASRDFAAQLELGTMDTGVFQMNSRASASRPGGAAVLRYTLMGTTRFYLRVRSARGAATGAYTLTDRAAPSTSAAPPGGPATPTPTRGPLERLRPRPGADSLATSASPGRS